MKTISHKFVEFIPSELENRVLYISVEFCTAVHKCFCGCGSRVVTPITPNDWELIFDGESVSLYPSIGSWNLDCQSHYWIRNNKIDWAEPWSKEKIDRNRKLDSQRRGNNLREDDKKGSSYFKSLFRRK